MAEMDPKIMSYTRSTAINEVNILQVIEIKSIIGTGNVNSPITEISEYYSMEGKLLARKTIYDDLTIGKFNDENGSNE